MRALVLSGGGSRGSFQLGALEHMINVCGNEYDIIAGISVGALNGVMLAMQPVNMLSNGVQTLAEVWTGASDDGAVWEHWFIPYLPGVIYRDSFYNASPLMDTVKRVVNDEAVRASGRKLRIGCVKYGTGEYIDADENTTDLWKWVYASAAYPAFFAPIMIDGDLIMDGGARRITPLKAAIKAGATSIDVVITSPIGAASKPVKDNWLGTKITGVDVALRAIELQGTELFERDLMLCDLHNKFIAATGRGTDELKRTIDVRVIAPTKQYIDNPLRFDASEIASMRRHGRECAERIVK